MTTLQISLMSSLWLDLPTGNAEAQSRVWNSDPDYIFHVYGAVHTLDVREIRLAISPSWSDDTKPR